jgi:hypothetical protein
MSERTAEQIARDVAAKYLKRPPLAVTPKSPQDDTPPASEIPEHVSAPQTLPAIVPGKTAIYATPFVWRDPRTIPRRQFVYGTHLIRQFCSATFAAPGVGKSSQILAEFIALATNRPLLGIQPKQRCRVWYWNGEDPRDETERRIAAICKHYRIAPEELEGWFFFDSGRDQQIIIAGETRDGTKIAMPMVDALIAEIQAQRIDIMGIDPFVSSHRVTENDNNAIDVVAKQWNAIADATNIAIELSHHARKTYGAEVTVEDGRGAVALLAAVRAARTLNVMSEKEAEQVGITARRRYFKVEDGKANLSPPPEKADWYQLTSVFLENGEPADSEDHGDNIGVVAAWAWPDLMAGMTSADFETAAAIIRTDEWRKDAQAKKWVGHAIAQALKLDVHNRKDRAKINASIKSWLASGALVEVEGEDDKRRPKQFVKVADT